MVAVIVVPKPNLDSTVMSPPSYWQIFLQIDSPTPFPRIDAYLFEELSALQKGVKMFSTSSGDIPTPESATMSFRDRDLSPVSGIPTSVTQIEPLF